MFIKNGNIKEFGVKTNFQELKDFLNESKDESLVIDIHGVVQTLVSFSSFDWNVINRKNNKKELWLEDLYEQNCPIFINMKDIKKIIKGVNFFADQYILILKHNIMYHLYVE